MITLAVVTHVHVHVHVCRGDGKTLLKTMEIHVYVLITCPCIYKPVLLVFLGELVEGQQAAQPGGLAV